jgi:hypothetical protein
MMTCVDGALSRLEDWRERSDSEDQRAPPAAYWSSGDSMSVAKRGLS